MRHSFNSPVSRRPHASLTLTALFTSLLMTGCGGGGSGSPESPAAAAEADTGTRSGNDADAGTAQATALTVRVAGASINPTTYAGRGWFVDSAAGRDTNPGTAAAPWKTLARAARQPLAAGDALLLKCGGLWRESLNLNPANVMAGRATLGIWGTCTTDNRPRVSGARPVGGVTWTPAGGAFAGKPVHVAAWTRPVTSLYWNGTPLVRARYPNYGGIGREFRLISAVDNIRTLVPQASDAAALAGINLAGAKAVVRTSPWMVEAHDVSSSDSAGKLTLQSLAQYPSEAGEGFFVEGKLALLDSAGEWFHDAAAGLLYVWTPDGKAPIANALESVERDVGLSVAKVADTRIENLVFERHGQRSIEVIDGPRTTITDVSAQDIGHTAILIDGALPARSSGSSVLRSTVKNAAVMGISATSPSVQVGGNRVESTGVGATGTGVTAGIYINSVGGSVRDNTVINSGFAAVVLSFPTGLTVSGNTLMQACRRFTDCGAIYAGGAPSLPQRSSIAANHIGAMVPNSEGAIGGAASLVAGIYLDEASSSVDVLNNMISRTGVGINLHNSSNHVVQSNQVWLADRASIRVHNSSSTETVRGNVIQDNQLFASSHLAAAAQPTIAPANRLVYAQEWVHDSNARAMFTGANPNIVRRNVAMTMTAPAKVRWSLLSGYQQQTLDAAAWGAIAAQDSVKAPYAARPFIVTAGGSNLIENGALRNPGTGWMYWSGAPAAGGSISFGTCGTGCADLKVGSTSDFLMSSLFGMSANAGSNLYQLRVRAQALAPNAALTMAINRSSGDWGAMGLVLMNEPVSDVSETSIDTLFNATSADLGRVNMTGTVGSALRLRDVTVTSVGSYELLDPARESDMLVNAGTASRAFDCPSATLRTCTVSDLSGNAVQWPVTLSPGTSLVVLSSDAKWR